MRKKLETMSMVEEAKANLERELTVSLATEKSRSPSLLYLI